MVVIKSRLAVFVEPLADLGPPLVHHRAPTLVIGPPDRDRGCTGYSPVCNHISPGIPRLSFHEEVGILAVAPARLLFTLTRQVELSSRECTEDFSLKSREDATVGESNLLGVSLYLHVYA